MSIAKIKSNNVINNTSLLSWTSYRMDEIYTERKEPGEEGLPVLSVSIHSGVSDGELGEEELGKKVKRIEDKTQYRRAMAGDLVFNMMRAWQGAIGVVKTDGMVSPAYIVAKPNDKVYPLFMDYYMKTPRMIETIHRQSYGVTDFRLRLYWDSFAPIRCTLPPIEEQRRIAKILSTQDRVIELYDRKIEQLKRFKKGALSRLFPKPGCNTSEIRFPGFSEPWERRRFKDIFIEYSEKGHANLPVLTIIQGFGTVRRDESDRTLHYDRTYLSNYKMVNADDFIVHLRSFEGGLERATDTGIISPAYHTFRGEGIDSRFYYSYFRSSRFIDVELKPHVFGIRDGRSIDIEGMKSIRIPWTTIQEQQTIGSYIENLDRLITLHQRLHDEEIRKKKALMQLLLTGKVRV